MLSNKGLTINNRLIPWSFVYLVYRKCGNDWMQTKDAFWKARHAVGTAAVERYIRAGLKPRNGAVPYILQPSKDLQRQGGAEMICTWFDTLYVRKYSAPMSVDAKHTEDRSAMPSSIAQILADLGVEATHE